MGMLEPDLTPEDALKERTVKVRYYHAGEKPRKSLRRCQEILSEIYNILMETWSTDQQGY
jgi:hypothetical protein